MLYLLVLFFFLVWVPWFLVFMGCLAVCVSVYTCLCTPINVCLWPCVECCGYSYFSYFPFLLILFCFCFSFFFFLSFMNQWIRQTRNTIFFVPIFIYSWIRLIDEPTGKGMDIEAGHSAKRIKRWMDLVAGE